MKQFLGMGLLLGAIVLCSGVSMAEQKNIEKATFAGGCFWCMQPPFKVLEGVVDAIAGYMGGQEKDPTYKDYANKGHIEVVHITYDPRVVSYKALLDIFWQQIDPTDAGGQFGDRGAHYQSAIFYHTQEQKRLAQTSKNELEVSKRFSKPIVTEIREATPFYKAEESHQDYGRKNPFAYKSYRAGSGRDSFLKSAWGFKKPSREELHKKLTQLQYDVTQLNKTEAPFKNTYWDNKRAGVYVDVVSGEPLFSSIDKYVSGTGWPSFTKPLELENVIEKAEWSLFGRVTELKSKQADSHLGHLFKDGPKPTGLRYCVNSAALRFVPVKDLEKEGLGQYKSLFKNGGE